MIPPASACGSSFIASTSRRRDSSGPATRSRAACAAFAITRAPLRPASGSTAPTGAAGTRAIGRRFARSSSAPAPTATRAPPGAPAGTTATWFASGRRRSPISTPCWTRSAAICSPSWIWCSSADVPAPARRASPSCGRRFARYCRTRGRYGCAARARASRPRTGRSSKSPQRWAGSPASAAHLTASSSPARITTSRARWRRRRRRVGSR